MLVLRPKKRIRKNHTLECSLGAHFLYFDEDPLYNREGIKEDIFLKKLSWETYSIIISKSRIFLTKDTAVMEKYTDDKISSIHKIQRQEFEHWHSLAVDYFEPTVVSGEFLQKHHSTIGLIQEIPLTDEKRNYEVLDALLERYLGDDVIIPFSMEERRKKYPLAFEELKQYINKYTKAKR